MKGQTRPDIVARGPSTKWIKQQPRPRIVPALFGVVHFDRNQPNVAAVERSLHVLEERGRPESTTAPDAFLALIHHAELPGEVGINDEAAWVIDGQPDALPGQVAPLQAALGPLAAAVWQKKRLHLVKDFIGSRPLYWIRSGTAVAFSTEVRALVAWSGQALPVNHEHLRRLSSGFGGHAQGTAYHAIRRVPAGRTVTISADAVHVARHWNPWSIAVRPRMDFATAARGLREHLERSVDSRIPPRSRIGALVSGGLDSSSIACLASRRRWPLDTFTITFDKFAASDERHHSRHLWEQPAFRPHFVSGEGIDVDGFLRRATHLTAQPAWVPNIYLFDSAYRKAAASGVKVMFDGFDGDTVVGHGYRTMVSRALALRWNSLQRDIQEMSRVTGMARSQIVRQRVLSPIRRRLQLRRRHSQPPNLTDWGFHRRNLAWSLVGQALDGIDPIGARYGIEMQMPFYDRKLVEHCLAVPGRHRIRDGRTRAYFREAMQGILPEPIRTRPGKRFFGGVHEFNWSASTLIQPGRPWAEQVVSYWSTSLSST